MHPNRDTHSTDLDLVVTSVGVRHGDVPHGDIQVDLRPWFHNPHLSPELRELTGEHPDVIASVLGADGAAEFIRHAFESARVLVSLRRGPVTVTVACSGGRHRSVVAAEQITRMARAAGIRAQAVHRDIGKDVLPSSA